MSNPKKTKSAVKVGGIALIQSERGSITKQPEKNRKDGYRIRLFFISVRSTSRKPQKFNAALVAAYAERRKSSLPCA